MIQIINVHKTFESKGSQIKALRDVNIEIQKGDIFGIIGYSGAGKSTLIRCINGLEKPTEGQIKVEGLDIVSLSEKQLRGKRKEMGMIFQHFNLMASRTVSGNIAFPLKDKKLSKLEKDKKVDELLKLVGLEDKKNAYPSQLSGGQKQRVAIARALATDPKILLCDEATSALDPITTKSILTLLKELQKALGLTIVLITHQMEVIREICTKVAVMEYGKVVEQGSVVDVFTKPQSSIAKDFVTKHYHYERTLPIQQNHIGMMLHLQYIGDTTNTTLISEISKQFSVDANITYGNIEKLQDTLVGNLVIDLRGDEASVHQALEYIQSKSVEVEVISDERIVNEYHA